MSKREVVDEEHVSELRMKTKAGLQEMLARQREENEQLRKLLSAIKGAELHRAVFPASIQQLMVQPVRKVKKEEPETPPIKEEQQVSGPHQEEDLPQNGEEAETKMLTFMLVPLKNEDEAVELQQPKTEEDPDLAKQIKSEPVEEDSMRADASSDLDPGDQEQPSSAENSSDCETEDSDDYIEETRESRSNLLTGRRDKSSSGDSGSSPAKNEKQHRSGEKLFSCSKCSKAFSSKIQLKLHMKWHSGGKLFNCSVCEKSFAYKSVFQKHMKTH